MKLPSACLLLSIILALVYNAVSAAVPIISYTPSTNVYTVGTPITTLTPGNSGGAVSGVGFGTATALTGATLSLPRGIAIDVAGNVYVANSGNNTISKYNSSGTYLSTFGSGATMSFPKDLVFDSQGNAYVLNLGATPGTGSVYKYNSSGVYQSTILSGLNYALGITIDASDNIYIADQGAVTVKKYSTSGSLLLSLPTTNLSTPLGVATDASGNIYVLNNGNGFPGTGTVTKYNSAGTFQSTLLSGYTSAQAITIDPSGNIYVADNAFTNVVNVYNSSGTFITSKAVTDPEGVAVDASGNMFVSGYFLNQMNEFKPTGGYFLSGTLPAGLSFNSTTGAISGTPTAAMAATTYTITAYNASGSATTTVNITVNPTAPTGTGGIVCNTGTTVLTASGSSPSGGVYSWYAALTGGSALATGTTFTTPTITTTTTYYVSYTQNGATSTPRTAVTATVNASPAIATAPTSPTGSLYLSYPFTGNANDVSGNSNNGILQNSPTLTTDRYGVANSAYSFNGTNQYVSTTTLLASPGPQNFSISIWFKTSAAGGKLVGFGNLQAGQSTAWDRHIYMTNTGQIYFGTFPNPIKTLSTTASYADGNWHHVVVTESSTNGANLYMDGVLQATDGTMIAYQPYAGYWRIGYDNLATWPNQPTNSYFTGSLDDVAIYNTELTAAQVYTLYGGGSTPVCVGGTMTLQANTVAGATYSWSGPNSFTSSLQNPTIANVTSAKAGTYTVTVTANGCSSQLNVTGVVNNSGPAFASAPTSPTSGLYLSYPFSTNANDVSGNSNNGILQNSPTLTTDRYGTPNSAYSFNGTNQYVSTTTLIASPGPQNFSISIWFKTSTAGGKLIGFGGTQTGSSTAFDRHIYMTNSGQIYFGTFPNPIRTLSTTASYADGIWHHVVVTESATNGANLYMDGVLQATDGTMIAYQPYAGYWRIGYDNLVTWPNAPTNYYFTGSLDDVAIYNTELTAAQVYTLYGGGSAPVCAGGTMTLQANTISGATYSWSGPNSFTSTLQNPTIANVTSTNAGTYTVTATSAGGCTSQLNVTGVVTSSGPALAAVPTSPASGLYLSYPFSTNANDVSGNSNNGTLQNSPTLTTDHYGAVNSAYSFNGTSQYVSTTTLTASPGPQNYSISIWFKTSTAGGKLIGFGDTKIGTSGHYDRHIYMSNSGQLYFGISPLFVVRTINTTASYADGSWHHVVATESTTNGANLYVDGVLQATDGTMTASESYAGYWKVGYDNLAAAWTNKPTNYYFTGSLDDVAIYNTELTATQVYTLYGGGSAPVCAGSTMTLQANTVAGATYAWTGPNSFTSSLQNPTIANATLAKAGTYTVVVTSASGCTSQLNVTGVVTSSGPALASVPTSPSSGLYLSYPFSTNANDVSGNNNNGTLQNSPTLTTDHYGAVNSAYSFNGTSQYVSTTTNTASPGPQNFSISVWFKTSSAGGKLVGFGSSQTGSSGSDDRHIYMTNAGLIYFGLSPLLVIKTIHTTTGYADGSWHHVVATESTTNGANLYVDGVLQATDVTMKASQSYAGYWRVGYDNMVTWPGVPTSYYFNGSLDDVAIYNTELTASQVYALYGGGSAPVLCPGSTMTLQANTVSSATYAWSGPNGFTSTLQNPTIAGATSVNAGVYTLTVTSASGCNSQLSVTGVVNSAPSATFTATSTVSINSPASITYTGTDPATSTYSWDFNGGTPSTGTGQGPFNVQWATTGTKTITLNITNANGCSNSSTQSVNVVTSYGNYAFQDAITLNTTSLGITSNLTNFPALLSIQDNDLIISNTCADKVQNPNGPNYDFAFVSGASELYYQVESYNQTTGTLLVWVQIPTLTYAANNAITFYFGSKSPPVTHNTAFFANTWASNYLAVFHFNEASYTGSVADGTSGGHTGTTSGMTSADLVTGKIGTAYSFNGSTKKITTNAVSVTGPFTLSAWVKLGATGLDQKIMTNQAAGGGTSGGYKLGVYITNFPETESGIASNRATTPNPAAFTSGTWYYVQGVYSGTTLSTYVNGVQYKTLTVTNNPSANASFYIGVGEGGGTNNFNFNGIIDEPRVSNVAKTADWLKAEYGNQNNPVTFTTVGTTLTNTTSAAAIPGALTYTYKGVTSTYTDPTNWDNTTAGTTNQAPAFDGTANLIIPTGTSISLNSDAAVYGLTLNGTATVSLSANLSVACNIYNQGTGKIDWNNLNTSKITWNGSSAAQSYNGATSGGYAHVGTMELNNSVGGTVTINSDTLDIYSELKITKGNLAIASGAIMALKSGISQTASVDAIPTGYSITGNVYAERYFKAGTIAANTRNYRILSSPVNTAAGVYNLAYLNTNSGVFSGVMTGGPTGTAGGFTVTSANPTVYLYREDLPASNANFNSGNYKGLTNILGNTLSYYAGIGTATYTTTLPVGNGYLLYYVGNNVNNVTSGTALNKQFPFGGSLIDPDASTSVAVGTLNQGSIPVKLWWNSSTTLSKVQTGYNLVGNPYASSIDWDTFSQSTSTNGIYGPSVSATIYVFNYTSKNFGAYTALTPGGIGTNNATRYIASGQGFFVQATGSGAALTFNEVAKTTVQPNSLGSSLYLLMGMPKETKTGLLRVKLAADQVNTDDIMILFDPDSKNEYEPFHDVDRLKGIGNISTLASYGNLSSTMLSINRMHTVDSATRIKLHVNATKYNNADTLSGTGFDSLDPRYDVYLIDHYKKDSLFFSKYHQYLFNIDKTDTASFGANRFELVFHKKASYNYHLLGFSARIVKEGVLLTWKTENEGNLTGFNIERKDGSGAFVSLQSMQSNSSGEYTYLDRSPAAGINYYRLQQADPFGAVTYSKVIAVNTVSNNTSNDPITLYPNPVSTQFTIRINTDIPAKVLLRITNAIGQTVIFRESEGNNIQQSVTSLVPGSYIVEITDKATRNLIGTKKFIKR